MRNVAPVLTVCLAGLSCLRNVGLEARFGFPCRGQLQTLSFPAYKHKEFELNETLAESVVYCKFMLY